MTVEQLFVVVVGNVMGLVWTSLLFVVVFPSLLGMMLGESWWSPTARFWWRYCIVFPVQLGARLLATLFGAIAGGNQGGGQRRQRRRRPRDDDDDE